VTKNILLDARDIYHDAGMGYYTRGLIEIFKLLPEDKFTFCLLIKSSDFNSQKVYSLPGNFSYKPVSCAKNFPGDLWYHFKTSVISYNFDFFFCPVTKISPVFTKNSIITVHDLAVFEKSFAPNKKARIIERLFLLPASLRAKKIICVSNSTKDKFLQKYSFLNTLLSKKTSVIHSPAVDISNIYSSESDRDVLGRFKMIQNEYLFFVGKIEPRKNIQRLIYAYKKFLDFCKKYKKSAPKLVLSGGKGWDSDVFFESVDKLNLKDHVIFTGRITDFEKKVLLSNCLFFVFPSLYEGFGFPVLEALRLKKPVLTSMSTSLTEVGGKNAIYVNPFDVQKIYFYLRKLYLNSELRDKISRGAKKQAQKFSLSGLRDKVKKLLN
jgi:glycosyltransferase involved in cell wall biosynthesis